MALPPSHPAIGDHQHVGMTCPVTGASHEWCPPQPGDSRSPCPALNVLANHGYIARDGKNLSVLDLIAGLKAGYNLSTPLAAFLVVGGFVLLRRFSNLDLHDIGVHGRIEHNASLVHADTPAGEIYAPIEIHQNLVEELLAEAKAGDEEGVISEAVERRMVLDAIDVAHARIRREKESPRMDAFHAEIARGEMAIILGVLEAEAGSKTGVPVEWMRDWIGNERLPQDWTPTHVQGLLDVVRRSRSIHAEMKAQRMAEKAEAQDRAKL